MVFSFGNDRRANDRGRRGGHGHAAIGGARSQSRSPTGRAAVAEPSRVAARQEEQPQRPVVPDKKLVKRGLRARLLREKIAGGRLTLSASHLNPTINLGQ